MVESCENEMKKDEENFTWKMKKFLCKRDSINIDAGPIANKFEYNRKLVGLIMNKEMEDFTYTDASDLLHVSVSERDEYYQYYIKYMTAHFEDEYEFDSGIKTSDDFFLPCKKKVKKFSFIGKNYEEHNYIIIINIDSSHLQGLNKFRLNNKQVEDDKVAVKKAKLFKKFLKIRHVDSDAWKTLCLLYYGNKPNNEEVGEDHVDDENFNKEKFWQNVDESKVCKFRLIDKPHE